VGSVIVAPVEGTVRVKVRGSKRFRDLKAGETLKAGAEVDTRKGRVTITGPGTGNQADFYAGLFRISQTKGLTTLTLSEKLTGCRKRSAAHAAAKKKPKSRRLWGSGKGKFRTKGSYSAATVRGTKWLVQDTCTSTLTRVTQGVVRVRDNVKRKTVTVRKGKRYIARAKRR
jgi:hypothetical protein